MSKVLKVQGFNININNQGDLYTRKGISLTQHSTEKIVILGSSGVGKSILFESLLGLQISNAKTVGTIKVIKQIGYLYTQNHFDVQETLETNFRNYYRNFSLHADMQQITAFIKHQEGLSMNTLVSSLSFGTQRRMAFYRCYFQKSAKLLFLDEPTIGFDQQRVKRLVKLIKDDTKRAYLIISHEESLVKLADRLVVLSKKYHTFVSKGRDTAFLILSYGSLLDLKKILKTKAYSKDLTIIYKNRQENKLICRVPPRIYTVLKTDLAESLEPLYGRAFAAIYVKDEPLTTFLKLYVL